MRSNIICSHLELHMHVFPCDISKLFWMLHFFTLQHLLQLTCNCSLFNPFRHSDFDLYGSGYSFFSLWAENAVLVSNKMYIRNCMKKFTKLRMYCK